MAATTFSAGLRAPIPPHAPRTPAAPLADTPTLTGPRTASWVAADDLVRVTGAALRPLTAFGGPAPTSTGTLVVTPNGNLGVLATWERHAAGPFRHRAPATAGPRAGRSTALWSIPRHEGHRTEAPRMPFPPGTVLGDVALDALARALVKRDEGAENSTPLDGLVELQILEQGQLAVRQYDHKGQPQRQTLLPLAPSRVRPDWDRLTSAPLEQAASQVLLARMAADAEIDRCVQLSKRTKMAGATPTEKARLAAELDAAYDAGARAWQAYYAERRQERQARAVPETGARPLTSVEVALPTLDRLDGLHVSAQLDNMAVAGHDPATGEWRPAPRDVHGDVLLHEDGALATHLAHGILSFQRSPHHPVLATSDADHAGLGAQRQHVRPEAASGASELFRREETAEDRYWAAQRGLSTATPTMEAVDAESRARYLDPTRYAVVTQSALVVVSTEVASQRYALERAARQGRRMDSGDAIGQQVAGLLLQAPDRAEATAALRQLLGEQLVKTALINERTRKLRKATPDTVPATRAGVLLRGVAAKDGTLRHAMLSAARRARPDISADLFDPSMAADLTARVPTRDEAATELTTLLAPAAGQPGKYHDGAHEETERLVMRSLAARAIASRLRAGGAHHEHEEVRLLSQMAAQLAAKPGGTPLLWDRVLRSAVETHGPVQLEQWRYAHGEPLLGTTVSDETRHKIHLFRTGIAERQERETPSPATARARTAAIAMDLGLETASPPPAPSSPRTEKARAAVQLDWLTTEPPKHVIDEPLAVVSATATAHRYDDGKVAVRYGEHFAMLTEPAVADPGDRRYWATMQTALCAVQHDRQRPALGRPTAQAWVTRGAMKEVAAHAESLARKAAPNPRRRDTYIWLQIGRAHDAYLAASSSNPSTRAEALAELGWSAEDAARLLPHPPAGQMTVAADGKKFGTEPGRLRCQISGSAGNVGLQVPVRVQKNADLEKAPLRPSGLAVAQTPTASSYHGGVICIPGEHLSMALTRLSGPDHEPMLLRLHPGGDATRQHPALALSTAQGTLLSLHASADDLDGPTQRMAMALANKMATHLRTKQHVPPLALEATDLVNAALQQPDWRHLHRALPTLTQHESPRAASPLSQ